MGMEQKVVLGEAGCPAWPAVEALLKEHHFLVQMRMIDGQLSFPDEMPPENWQELRLGTPAGMITVRRQNDALLLVTWGNADEPLCLAWNALTWAFAEAAKGNIAKEHGTLSAAEYREQMPLPQGF